MKLKKIIVGIIFLFLIAILTGCSWFDKNKEEDNKNEQEQITWTIDMVDITITDEGIRPEPLMERLKAETLDTEQFITDYSYQWIMTKAKDRNGNLINQVFNYEDYFNGVLYDQCFYDAEESQKEKEVILNDVKQVYCDLKNGYYKNYGYDSDADFYTFITEFIGENYGVSIESLSDFAVFLIYQDVVEAYYNEVSSIDNINDLYVKLNYAEMIDAYFYCKGYHSLVCKKNSDDIIYLESYSDQDKIDAQALYDLMVKVVANYQYDENNGYTLYDYFVRLSDLFNNGNFSEIGTALEYYFNLGNVQASEFEVYYLKGFSIITETLEVEPGQMVAEFEAAVKEMFIAQLDEVIQNITYENDMIHEGAIVTTFGYHFYVNEVCSLDSIFYHNEVLKVPSKAEFAMYNDFYNNSDLEDYIDPVALFVAYQKAIDNKDIEEKEKAIDAILEYVKYLDLDCLANITKENVESEFIDAYLRGYTDYNYVIASLKENETINYDDITLGNGAANSYYFYLPIYELYSGNYYYMYTVLMEMIEEFKEIDFGGFSEAIHEKMDTYLSAYQNKLGDILDHKVDLSNGILQKINEDLYNELQDYFKTLPSDDTQE